MKSNYLALFLLLVASISHYSQAQEYYSEGYTIIRETPITNADLKQTINKSVYANNILQGLQQILEGTGWRLAGYEAAHPDIHHLYQAPWPDHWRYLGPDELMNILETVGGEGWQLVIDPVNRLITYEVKPQFSRGRR